ncbi:hypothetical protein ACFFGT_24230 [Mucilaginibacter angelicae]|uniref:HNH endonuclease n=1 Tax=Mucilaginibacter angelicae TaxID=869718 RepID=A0ABV6LD12_9SPHI
MAGKIGRNIPSYIYRSLLARSGNKCAFPGCTHAVVNADNKFQVQLCHIESVAHEEQRYNPNLTEDQVNSYDNLMYMCLKHHIETNDETIFTVAKMRAMKYDHEANYVENPYNINMSHLVRLQHDSEQYWSKIEEIANDPKSTIAKVKVNTSADYEELSNDIGDTVEHLQELLNLVGEECKKQNWKLFNVDLPENISKISVLTKYMQIKYLEAYVLATPQDMAAKSKLDKMRETLLKLDRN